MISVPSPYKSISHSDIEIQNLQKCFTELHKNLSNCCCYYDPIQNVMGKIICESTESPIKHCIMNLIQDFKSTDSKTHNLKGLYIFTKKEPCIMCAMALIHARVDRLYFCDEREKDGGIIKHELYSKSPPLNHKYLAFKVNF